MIPILCWYSTIKGWYSVIKTMLYATKWRRKY